MKKYPSVKIAITIIFSILISKLFNFSATNFTISILFILLIISLYLSFKNKLFFYFSLFFCFSIYFLFFNDRDESINNLLDLDHPLEFTIEVLDEPKKINERTHTIINVLDVKIDNKKYIINSLSIFSNRITKQIKYGDKCKVIGFLNSPLENRIPGEFSYKNYLSLQKIYSIFKISNKDSLFVLNNNSGNYFVSNFVIPTREFVRKVSNTPFNEQNKNFILGLLLGDRTNISNEIKNAFIKTGTIHVLAVSGSHVILVIALIFYFFGFLRFNTKIKILLSILVLIFYSFLTGNTPSVQRAVIMAIIILLGKLFQEKTNIFNSLGIACIILLIKNPNDLFDPGFQLSFSAVFSMVFYYPKVNEKIIITIPEKFKKYFKPIVNLFSLSFAAQIGTIPFTIIYFKSISFLSILINLIVVPIVGLIIVIGFISVVMGIFSISISFFYNIVNDLLISFVLKFVIFTNNISFGRVEILDFNYFQLSIYLFILFVFTFYKNKIVLKNLIISILIISNIYVFSKILDQQNSEIIFFDVGQGDASYLICKCGANAIIDNGPNDINFEKIIYPFLKKRKVEKIKYIFISHPHLDHFGGIMPLLKSFNFDTLYDSGEKSNAQIYSEYQKKAKNKISSLKSGSIVNLCDHSKFYIFSPNDKMIFSDSSLTEFNNNSLVMKFATNYYSIFFPGDVEKITELKIAKIYKKLLNSDILKSPHHGSITSSNEDLINFIAPKKVIISVGKFNKFGHPSKIILERYKKIKAEIFRTDNFGSVFFKSDKKNILTIVNE